MPRVTITVPEKNAQPYRFQLDRQVVTLGRGSENDIAIESASVSVHHAEMRRIEGGYELRDIGSTNGIKLDGVRLDLIPLRSGATVKIGDVSFDFMLTDEEISALAREKPIESSPITREAEVPVDSKPSPQMSASASAYPARRTDGGCGSTLLFLILAIAAVCAGLAIRHQKETGTSLLDAIKTHLATPPAPPAPPAPPEK